MTERHIADAARSRPRPLARTGILAVAPNGDRVQLPGTWLEVEVKQLPAIGTYARFDFTVKLRGPTERIVIAVYDAVAAATLWGEAQVKPKSSR